MALNVKIDTKDFDNYKKSLNSLSKSAYPTAVRNTLNNAGFDMKKNELHKAAKEKFDYTRSKNFFKRFSYVNKAYGNNVSRMKSKVGLRDLGQQSAKAAVQNMGMHQTGGTITKGNPYLDDARISSNRGRLVRKKDYFKKGNVLKNLKGSYVQRATKALKEKKPFWHNKNGTNFLIQIQSIRKTKKSSVKIKSKLILRKGRNARIKPNKFIQVAANRTLKKTTKLFKVEFNKQFTRYVGRKK